MSVQLPPFIPDNAPFTPEQRSWLNGYLAGLFSVNGAAEAAPAQEVKPVTILWGSQTGNTEGLAKKVSKQLKANGFAPSVVDMGEYDKSKLAEEDLLLVMTSTYGEGEPPDNAADLHGWLLGDDAPKLEKLRYSVLALGDTNYPDYCKCGIEFDERLAALGGVRLTPRVDCDVDYEEPFEAWFASLSDALGAAASASDDQEAEPSEPAFGKKNPFPAPMVANRNLNGEGSAKETRHVEFSLEGSGLSYEPGDALAVCPENDPSYVSDLIALLDLSSSDSVSLPSGESAPLDEALRIGYDVTNLSPKVVKAYAALAGDDALTALSEDKEALKEYSWGRQLIDLLGDYKHAFASAAEFVAILPKLAPRLYSISSSPRAHPEQVHVTVGVVRYESHGRERGGVCSNYLARLGEDAKTRIYFHATKTFKLPEDGAKPVIMVGPGTGIAPFRAFIEERKATEAKGENWLFFGDQRCQTDFLYQEELEAYFRDGLITRLDTAFSRDQEEKVYVQHRMLENGAELFAWLEKGAYFYVCGDASRMAKDVDDALHKVIEIHGNMSIDESQAYVKLLKSNKRYLRDVY